MWSQFIDSHAATIKKAKSLSKVENFNYLRSVSSFVSINENYEEAMSLLKNSFRNNQKIVTAHMDSL